MRSTPHRRTRGRCETRSSLNAPPSAARPRERLPLADLASDPAGERFGIPTFPSALRARRIRHPPPTRWGLRPGGQEAAAQILRPRRRRELLTAYLYRVDLALPAPMTPGMWRAHAAMMRARCRCSSGRDARTTSSPPRRSRADAIYPKNAARSRAAGPAAHLSQRRPGPSIPPVRKEPSVKHPDDDNELLTGWKPRWPTPGPMWSTSKGTRRPRVDPGRPRVGRPDRDRRGRPSDPDRHGPRLPRSTRRRQAPERGPAPAAVDRRTQDRHSMGGPPLRARRRLSRPSHAGLRRPLDDAGAGRARPVRRGRRAGWPTARASLSDSRPCAARTPPNT